MAEETRLIRILKPKRISKPIPKISYPTETLGTEDDDGTMVQNVAQLTNEVVGHKIVKFEQMGDSGKITLDTGKIVFLQQSEDCCAYTHLEAFLLNPELIDHIIMGVGTTDGYTKWHIYADMGDVLKLQVGWSSGNPFYYGYGFDITVLATPQDFAEFQGELNEA